MTHRARFRLSRFAAAGVAAALLCPTYAGAQDDATLEQYFNDTHVLRRIFFVQEYQPLQGFWELERHEKEAIVFFLGSSGIDQLPGGLTNFVRNGGAVIIATTTPTSFADRQIIDLTGQRVVGRPIVYPRGPNETDRLCYQGKDHCPFLVPVANLPAPFDKLFHRPGTNESLTRVAANDASRLYPAPGRPWPDHVRRVVSLPPGTAHDGATHIPSANLLFAVGGDLGYGRFLVLANHRLFLNRMMLPDDTDNVEFAQNCLSILSERPDGQRRTKLLFVQYGRPVTDFNVPFLEIDPLEHLPELIAAGIVEFGKWLPQLQINLARAEDRDDFHRGLWNILESKGVTGADVTRWVILTASGLFAVYGLFRIGTAGRHRLDPSAPLLTRAVAKQVPQDALSERRRQAMLDNNNLWEAARERARTALAAAGVEQPIPGAREPKVHVRDGSWWQRWRTRRRVLRLWRLAFGPTPQRVPRAAWDLVNHELDELTAALASGAIQLT
jgi:hypothetical protein